MGRIGDERALHGDLGVIDCVLTIAREPVIDPGVGPPRIELNGGGEGLFGALSLAERRPGLAVGVMRRRKFRPAPAGFARRVEHGLIVAERKMRNGRVKERAGIVAGRRLRLSEAPKRFGMTPCGLKHNAKLKLRVQVARVELDGPA